MSDHEAINSGLFSGVPVHRLAAMYMLYHTDELDFDALVILLETPTAQAIRAQHMAQRTALMQLLGYEDTSSAAEGDRAATIVDACRAALGCPRQMELFGSSGGPK